MNPPLATHVVIYTYLVSSFEVEVTSGHLIPPIVSGGQIYKQNVTLEEDYSRPTDIG